MKKLGLIFVLILIIFSYSNIYALEACTTSELSRLKELANNVKFNSVRIVMGEDQEGKSVEFIYDIDILNNDKSLRLAYKTTDIEELQAVENNATKIEGLSPGERVTFYIYAYTANLCVDELLRTVTVDLPISNEYYYFHKDKCLEYPDFKYCQEFSKVDKDFDEIDKLFQEYIDKKSKVIPISKDNAIWWYVIIGSVVLIGVTSTILIINYRKRKTKDDI